MTQSISRYYAFRQSAGVPSDPVSGPPSGADDDGRDFWSRLARLQVRHWPWVLACAVLLGGSGYYLSAQLKLRTSWEELLPRDTQSVRDIERVRGRVKGQTSLTVVVRASGGNDGILRFGRDLAARLETKLVEKKLATAVDWRVDTYERFVTSNKHLFANLEDLREVQTALEERLDWERLRRNPLYVALDDEEPESPEAVLDRLKKKADTARERFDRFPEGMYVDRERTLLAMFVKTDMAASDVENTSRLMAAVNEEIAALRPTQYDPSLRTEFSGEIPTAGEEHDAIRTELLIARVTTMVLSLIAIVFFFRRLRMVPLLGLGTLVPAGVTFAFAQLTVGQLNISTAFLGAILIGNGINPGIMWMARFVEERASGRDFERAVAITHRETWGGTFTASLAASLAYGSLMITEFRGFREFGIIGAFGMVCCWSLTYLFVPSWMTVFERIRPMPTAAHTRGATMTRFARFSRHYPRTVIAVATLLGILGATAAVIALRHGPIEYDFRKLRSERQSSSRASKTNGEVSRLVGATGAGGAVVMMVDDLSHVPIVERELERLRKGPDGEDRYGAVRTVANLLPKEQETKLPVLAEVRRLLLEVREYANETQRAQIDEHLPPAVLRALTADDLPEEVARRFTERDGVRGRLLLVEPNEKRSIWDGAYLVEWTEAMREVQLPDGSRPAIIGRGPIFADMVSSIWHDGPRAIALSFTMVLILVVLAFRQMLYRFIALFVLLIGVSWMTGTLVGLELLRSFGFDFGPSTKLNFLNFVALPITFGIGVDYATNVVRRFVAEVRDGGADPIQAAADETGGAVVLCSVTTVIGYSSLYTSANKALQGFGLAASIGEVATMFAAQIMLPAIFVVVLAHLAKKKATKA